MKEIGRIESEKLRQNVTSDRYRFVLRASTGRLVAASEPFNTSARKINKLGDIQRGPKEQIALEQFVTQLIHDGWRVAHQPTTPWYSLTLAQGSEEDLERLKRDLFIRGDSLPSRQREGVSVQKMWGITLFVVIALFVVCVVLVLSAEIQITPVT